MSFKSKPRKWIEQDMKCNENVRKIRNEWGIVVTEIEKYGVWFNAYTNTKGEVSPSLYTDDTEKLKEVLSNIEQSGEKSIDFSNWGFCGIYFDNEMQNFFDFAEKINFTNASFCMCTFEDFSSKNVDFSSAIFEWSILKNSSFRNCNFQNVNFKKNKPDEYGNPTEKMKIVQSSFANCNFENAQFNDARLLGNKFTKTNIEKADFHKAEVSGNTGIRGGNKKQHKESVIQLLQKLKKSTARQNEGENRSIEHSASSKDMGR